MGEACGTYVKRREMRTEFWKGNMMESMYVQRPSGGGVCRCDMNFHLPVKVCAYRNKLTHVSYCQTVRVMASIVSADTNSVGKATRYVTDCPPVFLPLWREELLSSSCLY